MERYINKFRVIGTILVFCLLITMLFPGAALGAIQAKQMKAGSYVETGSYNGKPIVWLMMDNNEHGTLLLSERIITYKAFTARLSKEGILPDQKIWSKTRFRDRELWGHGVWEESSLRTWLNSDSSSVTYTIPPDMYHVDGNTYADEPGFLTNFSTEEINIILSVQQKQYLNEIDKDRAVAGSHVLFTSASWPFIHSGNTDPYYNYVTDRVFLLGLDQFIKYFYDNSGNITRNPLAFPTAEAHEKDDNQADNYPPSWYSHYWLRTFSGHEYIIQKSSAVFGGEPPRSVYIIGVTGRDSKFGVRSMGVRPALYIQSSARFIGDGSKNNPYKLAGSGADPIAATVDIDIYIDGQKQTFADQPVMMQGRTLLPMRALFQALGSDVEWEGATSTAIGTRDGIEVRIPIGSKSPTINGTASPIDVPAQLIGGRTYIPLRFVGEALGDDVEWDGATSSVIISKK